LKKKILIAEDEKVLQMIYREELEEEGYEVCVANNGQEALNRLDEEKFDLVLLDIVMPVMDGISVLDRVKARNRNFPVVLHTSHPNYADDPRSLLADAFIIKSGDLVDLKTKIKSLLEN
jgi:CheY-like chemotaxis protein